MIYFDNSATTMTRPEVAELVAKMMANNIVAQMTPEVVKNASVGIEESIKEEVKSIPTSPITPPVVEKPRMEKPKIEKPMITKSEEVVLEDEPVRKPGKPASFGKLLGSVR